ncbi:MAG: peptide chain release factor N(5)-glutamine methyltransferase [Bacteroidetes bacterium]|nr:peptide chain release factor N(5)-glutamine methyltransferase [Bacteroidota bacterium]
MRKAPALERIWTVMDLLRWGTDYFAAKDIDSPRLTMELMLSSVLQCTRLQLYTNFEQPLTKDELAALRHMIERRVKREPLQYILGKADFYGLAFDVTPDVLIPRPETEILVERAVRFLKTFDAPVNALDIGTGTGCIPIACLKYHPGTQWTAIDKSHAALDVASRNAEHHGALDHIHFLHLDFFENLSLVTRHSSLNSSLVTRHFSLISMNPPYIPSSEVPTLQAEVRDFEPHMALTDDGDGTAFYVRLADVGKELLAPHGRIFMEVAQGQSEEVQEIFTSRGYETSVILDLASIPRIVTANLFS